MQKIESPEDFIRSELLKAGFSESLNSDNPAPASFSMREDEQGRMRFRVSVASDRRSGEGMSEQSVNDAINDTFHALRAAGGCFTQPVGISGTGWEDERTHGTTLEFKICSPEKESAIRDREFLARMNVSRGGLFSTTGERNLGFSEDARPEVARSFGKP